MFTVGITGGIGSGKSTVCRVFGVLGVPVFSSDEAGKRILDTDPAVREQLVEAFGAALHRQGTLDRKVLAGRVFNDPAALARLNAIVHPVVREAFASWAAAQHAPYVLNEAAILVETGAYKQLDHLIVVEAPVAERVRRVMLRDGVSSAEVQARMDNQANDAQRAAVAHTLVRNDGHTMVIPQVINAHRRLLALAQQ
ncbi:MAG: dephospho-CoA kinase [Flavobacteriales bacterium]|nr:dephospho-CoA kinase [Flavobacteriales bacterium]